MTCTVSYRRMPQFKYGNNLRAFPNCPPPAASNGASIGFRFVHNPITARCFLPTALKSRTNRAQALGGCSAFGLSMFTTEAGARAKFARLKVLNPNIGKSIGDHVALVKLDSSCGLQTTPDPNGHFDLHEFVPAKNLATVSQIVGSL